VNIELKEVKLNKRWRRVHKPNPGNSGNSWNEISGKMLKIKNESSVAINSQENILKAIFKPFKSVSFLIRKKYKAEIGAKNNKIKNMKT